MQRRDRACRRPSSARRSCSRSSGPVSGPSCVIAATSVRLERPPARTGPPRDERRQRAAARRSVVDARDVLADAGEASRRQLVLRAPEEPHLLRPADERRRPARAPPSWRAASPFTCSQSDGRTTSVFGKRSARPTLVDPVSAACVSVRIDSSLVLQECRRSGLPSRSAYDPAVAGPLDRAGRAALRRDLRRGASRLPGAQPVQHRPPDAARLAGAGGGATLADWRERGVLVRGDEPALLVDRAGLLGPGRRRPHARGPRRVDRGDAVRGAARCCRTSARTPVRRRAACGCCARRARSSSRSSCSTTPSRSLERPGGEPDRRRRGGRRAHADVARSPADELDDRHAAADRRRPPPLRDRRRLPRRRTRRRRTRSPCSSRRARRDSRSSRRTASCAVGRRRPGDEIDRAGTGGAHALPRRRGTAASQHRRRLRPAASSSARARGRDLHAVRRRGDRGRRPRRGGGGVPAAAGDDRAGGALRRRGEAMPQKSTYFYPEAHIRACCSTRLG